MALQGYSFGGCTDRLPGTSPSSDHANVLPWVHWHRDPSMYPRDPQIQCGAGYRTILWPLVAALPQAIPLEWVFFVGHWLTLAATYALLMAIARRAGADRRAAWLTAILFAATRISPAGEPTFDAAFYTRGAALPVALAALWLVLADRPLAGLACLLLAITVHAATAFHAAALVLPLWLASATGGRRWARAAAGLAAFAALAVALAWLVGGGESLSLGRPSDEWMELQRITNAGHVFIDAINPQAWWSFGVLLIPVIWLAVQRPGAAVREDNAPRSGDVHQARQPDLQEPSTATTPIAAIRLARTTLLASGLLVLVGWMAAGPLPNKLLMQLLPLRGLKFSMVAATALLPAWFVCMNGPIEAARGRTARIAGRALLAAALAGLAARFDGVAGACLLAVCIAEWVGDPIGRHRRQRPASDSGYSRRAGGHGSRHERLFWMYAVVMCAALAAIPLRRDEWTYAPYDVPWRERHNAWLDLQRWCAAHLPADALVVVPPWLEGFRTYGRRSLFADWKTGGMSLYSDWFGRQWKARLMRLSPRRLSENVYDDLARNYDALTPAEFAGLVRDYGVTHIVIKRGIAAPPFREVYANAGLRVLETPAAP